MKLILHLTSTAFQGFFVDKQRNAAVLLGDRDLKTDVKNKRRRDK